MARTMVLEDLEEGQLVLGNYEEAGATPFWHEQLPVARVGGGKWVIVALMF